MTFTTNSWGGSRSVTFSADTSSVKYNSATASATVNVLYIPAGSITYTNDYSYVDRLRLYYTNSDYANVLNNNNGIEQRIDNLKETDLLYVYIRGYDENWDRGPWYSETFTAESFVKNGFTGTISRSSAPSTN